MCYANIQRKLITDAREHVLVSLRARETPSLMLRATFTFRRPVHPPRIFVVIVQVIDKLPSRIAQPIDTGSVDLVFGPGKHQKSARPKMQLHIRNRSFDFAFGEIIRVKQIRDSNDVKPKSRIGLVDFASGTD